MQVKGARVWVEIVHWISPLCTRRGWRCGMGCVYGTFESQVTGMRV